MLTIGILGGGQLARMLTLAASSLGWHTLCVDPSDTPCARDVTTVLQGDYTDETLLKTFAEQVAIVTLENENIPVDTLKYLSSICPVWPNADAVAEAQDRLIEKQLFQTLHIPTAPFVAVDSKESLIKACDKIGLPAVLKTRRFGYDGKGQYVIRTPADIETAWNTLGSSPLILEGWIAFEKEVSLIAARNQHGDCVFYPLVVNEHKNGILHVSRAPYEDEALTAKAHEYLTLLLNHLNYVGVLAVEFFVYQNELLANEMAPRVHNSGHWTIEGSETSQFEQHLRAIADLPLGSTQSLGYSILLNCVGEEPDIDKVLQHPNVFYHSYGKQAKPNRKLAHITINTDTKEEAEALLIELKKINPFSQL